MMNDLTLCHCGSGAPFTTCCGPFLAGKQHPETALKLMRSRYCAYVLGNAGYLMKTWSSATRPLAEDIVPKGVKWLGLEILQIEAGKTTDTNGKVVFVATFIDAGNYCTLKEESFFEKVNNRWRYCSGQPHVERKPISRSAKCPCGSGKKAKRCCLAEL